MAFHNTNWTAVPLPVGTYTIGDLGNGLTGSTVHEVFCLSNGSAKITAIGGGVIDWTAIAGQNIKVVCSSIWVVSGNFVGFKANHQANYRQQVGL